MSVLLVGCFFEQSYKGVCGDGEVTIDEQCDDGNTVDDDLCLSTCRTPPAPCGNGVLDEGEECDRAIKPSWQCRYDCTLYKEPRVRVSWLFQWYFDTSAVCLPGSPAVNLHAQELDENGAPIGAEIVQANDCGGGSAELVLAGFSIYNVWVDSASESKTYVSRPVTVDMRSVASGSVKVYVYVNAGFQRVAWSITDMQDVPLDCVQADAPEVEILLYGVAGIDNDQTVPCAPGSAIYGPVPIGTHQVRLNLVSPNHTFLATVGPFDVIISEPNAVHDASVTFKVTP